MGSVDSNDQDFSRSISSVIWKWEGSISLGILIKSFSPLPQISAVYVNLRYHYSVILPDLCPSHFPVCPTVAASRK
jgi:hypothetical protein